MELHIKFYDAALKNEILIAAGIKLPAFGEKGLTNTTTSCNSISSCALSNNFTATVYRFNFYLLPHMLRLLHSSFFGLHSFFDRTAQTFSELFILCRKGRVSAVLHGKKAEYLPCLGNQRYVKEIHFRIKISRHCEGNLVLFCLVRKMSRKSDQLH